MIYKIQFALLGKHVWRLMRFSDSLVARVLKKKYSRCNLPLQLNKADKPSYGWTSKITKKIINIASKIREKYTPKMRLEFKKIFVYKQSQQNRQSLLHQRFT